MLPPGVLRAALRSPFRGLSTMLQRRPRRFPTPGAAGRKEQIFDRSHRPNRASLPALPRRHSFACFWLFIQPPVIRPNSSSTPPTYNNCRWLIQPRCWIRRQGTRSSSSFKFSSLKYPCRWFPWKKASLTAKTQPPQHNETRNYRDDNQGVRRCDRKLADCRGCH